MKRQFLIILTTILSSLSLTGQDEELKKLETGNWLDLSIQAIDYEGQNISFESIGKLPEFPGGFDSLATFITDVLIYPESAIKDSVQGKVLLTFIVDSVGQVGQVEILKGVRIDLDSACISTVNQLPDWKPGRSWDNKAVKFKLGLPIRFILDEK